MYFILIFFLYLSILVREIIGQSSYSITPNTLKTAMCLEKSIASLLHFGLQCSQKCSDNIK